MSGDVQPRKRNKDKKKKKEDSTEQLLSQTYTPQIKDSNEDVNIHVHKEGGTGGGICAKIVFFLLFSALIVLVGLIITEHRGLTDIDTLDTESRFSQIFEGWTDNNIAHEDDTHLADSEEHDEHKLNELSEEAEEDESETPASDEENITEDEDEEDDIQETEEEEEEVAEDGDFTEENVESNEAEESQEDEALKDDLMKTKDSEEVEEVEKDEPNNGTQEDSRMAVKIGVGLCLLVVAYIVLIRKWKSAPSDISTQEQEPVIVDLTRRNTLVAPPSFQEIKQDIAETIEEDYSDEEEDESEIEEKPHHQLKSVQLKYQELKQTYSRSLTPESEPSEEEYEEEGDEDEDDDELLKRLEEKYGKLYAKQEEEEEEDDEEEELVSWKHLNVSDKEESGSEHSNGSEYEDDFKIKDKLDEAQKTVKDE